MTKSASAEIALLSSKVTEVTTRSIRGLHGQLLTALGERIVGGDWPPGTVIDVTEIESEYGVSRTTVREALKSLANKGLIDARPKIGTYVLPKNNWMYLDADVMTWRASGTLEPGIAERLAEMRDVIEPGAARLAAIHHTAADATELRAAYAQMVDSADGTIEELSDADARFHRAVLEATHNEFIQGLEVVLDRLLLMRNKLALSAPHAENYLALHEAVLTAILDRNAGTAELATRTLLSEAAEDVRSALNAGVRTKRPSATT
ncbi:hypothetical protein ACI1US_00362 [Leucobacter sp. BZR 635]